MATPPLITDLPTPTPDRSQPQAEFNTNTANFLNALPTMVSEENTLADWMNTTASEVESDATRAETASSIALSSANFVGLWSNQTGAANIPYSVEHNGITYQLLNNLADVTLSEPGITSDWSEINQKIRVTADVTVTVGTGGDYSSINEALDFFANRYPAHTNTADGITGEINLLAGFIMNEQVIVPNHDFSWVKITGVDAITEIERTSTVIPIAIGTGEDTIYPSFAAINGGQLPVIAQQFNVNASPSASTGRTGIFLWNTKSPTIIDFGGVNSTGEFGLYARNASVILKGDVSFSDGVIGIFSKSSKITANDVGRNVTLGSNSFYSLNAAGSDLYFKSLVCNGVSTVVNLFSTDFVAESVNFSGALSSGFGISANRGSRASVWGGTIQTEATPSTNDAKVNSGSTIFLEAAVVGGVSQTVNTLTADGIIYQ